jgi:hypothetical protein
LITDSYYSILKDLYQTLQSQAHESWNMAWKKRIWHIL